MDQNQLNFITEDMENIEAGYSQVDTGSLSEWVSGKKSISSRPSDQSLRNHQGLPFTCPLALQINL